MDEWSIAYDRAIRNPIQPRLYTFGIHRIAVSIRFFLIRSAWFEDLENSVVVVYGAGWICQVLGQPASKVSHPNSRLAVSVVRTSEIFDRPGHRLSSILLFSSILGARIDTKPLSRLSPGGCKGLFRRVNSQDVAMKFNAVCLLVVLAHFLYWGTQTPTSMLGKFQAIES